MDIDFAKALQGFDDVWRRVQQQKHAGGKKASPAPTQKKSQSRARRFNPGRR